MLITKVKCPACAGTGTLKYTPTGYKVKMTHAKRAVAIKLIKKGYGIREIARMLDVLPGSVYHVKLKYT